MAEHKTFSVKVFIKARLQDNIKRSSKTFNGIVIAANKNKAKEIAKREILEAFKDKKLILNEDVIVKECLKHSDFVFQQKAK